MEYRNPTYNAFGTIDLEVNHPEFGWIPFTAAPDDEASKALFTLAAAGEVAPYVPYVPSTEELADAARYQRNQLLAETDWSQLPDVPEATRLAYQPYRQALRDLTEQAGFPSEIEWPVFS